MAKIRNKEARSKVVFINFGEYDDQTERNKYNGEAPNQGNVERGKKGLVSWTKETIGNKQAGDYKKRTQPVPCCNAPGLIRAE